MAIAHSVREDGGHVESHRQEASPRALEIIFILCVSVCVGLCAHLGWYPQKPEGGIQSPGTRTLSVSEMLGELGSWGPLQE